MKAYAAFSAFFNTLERETKAEKKNVNSGRLLVQEPLT